MKSLGLIFKGAAMGVAEVIPGVSGGTIAFITGIYEELINSIKSFDFKLLKYLKAGEFKLAGEHINLNFLVRLVLGMVLGIVVGVFTISHLLESYPELLWAFFFGLILASVLFIYNMMKSPATKHLLPLFLGIIIAYGIVSLNPQVGSTNGLYLFFCGAIAICALILPGISGSFLLLLLGAYTLVVPTLKGFLESPELEEFKILCIFGAGCVVGLLLFSRVLSWTFKNYHDITLAVLSGFMLGSLVKIWPWRNPTQIINKETSEILIIDSEKYNLLSNDNFEIVKEIAVSPAQYFRDSNTILVVCMILLGFISVLAMQKLSKQSSGFIR